MARANQGRSSLGVDEDTLRELLHSQDRFSHMADQIDVNVALELLARRFPRTIWPFFN